MRWRVIYTPRPINGLDPVVMDWSLEHTFCFTRNKVTIYNLLTVLGRFKIAFFPQILQVRGIFPCKQNVRKTLSRLPCLVQLYPIIPCQHLDWCKKPGYIFIFLFLAVSAIAGRVNAFSKKEKARKVKG